MTKYDSFVKFHHIDRVLDGVLFGYVDEALWMFMKHSHGHLVEVLIVHPTWSSRFNHTKIAIIDHHLARAIQLGSERGLLKITNEEILNARNAPGGV